MTLCGINGGAQGAGLAQVQTAEGHTTPEKAKITSMALLMMTLQFR